MVIIAREFAVTGLRQLAMEQGHVIAANVWGKVKTILQIAMVLALIAVDDSPVWLDALVYVTVAVTIYSGVNIFFNFRAMLSARPRSAREASALVSDSEFSGGRAWRTPDRHASRSRDG